MDIILGKGEVFYCHGQSQTFATASLKHSGYTVLLFLMGKPGEIGRTSKKWKAGTEIQTDDPDLICRVIFENEKALRVFKERVAEL